MKFQLKALAVAALMAGAGVANAAIENSTSAPGYTTSEMIFVAYDSVNSVTYVRDLGETIGEFGFGGTSATGRRISLDGFSNFLDLADDAISRWAVLAYDGLSPTATYFTAAFNASGANLNATRVSATNGNIGSLMNSHNGLVAQGGHTAVADGWSIITAAGTGQGSTLFGANHNMGNAIVASALLGQQLAMYSFTGATAGGSTRTLLDNANPLSATDARFSVQGNELVFLNPVPEPGTYALMLAGLLTLGAVARRRNSK